MCMDREGQLPTIFCMTQDKNCQARPRATGFMAAVWASVTVFVWTFLDTPTLGPRLQGRQKGPEKH